MAIEIKAPTYPESVQEGSLATWHKQVGDSVDRDELIVDIETDKVVLEVVAPASGTISEILKAEGDTILSNEVIARIEEGAVAAAPAEASAEPEVPEPTANGGLINPAAKKLAEERGIDASLITGTGKGGQDEESLQNGIGCGAHGGGFLSWMATKSRVSGRGLQESILIYIANGVRS